MVEKITHRHVRRGKHRKIRLEMIFGIVVNVVQLLCLNAEGSARSSREKTRTLKLP